MKKPFNYFLHLIYEKSFDCLTFDFLFKYQSVHLAYFYANYCMLAAIYQSSFVETNFPFFIFYHLILIEITNLSD